jgi:hypothetical protein
LGRQACPSMPLRVPAPETRPECGPFPPAALFCAAIVGTTTRSDSRCTARDFASGLYARPCPDEGGADESLLFRDSPCSRAAPHTPVSPSSRRPPDAGVEGVAFVAKCSTRRSHCPSVEAAGFTSCCGPRTRSPRHVLLRDAGFRRPAWAVGISPDAWGLLPGALALTRTGLTPAGEPRPDDAVTCPGGFVTSSSSGRTIGRYYRCANGERRTDAPPCGWGSAAVTRSHLNPQKVVGRGASRDLDVCVEALAGGHTRSGRWPGYGAVQGPGAATRMPSLVAQHSLMYVRPLQPHTCATAPLHPALRMTAHPPGVPQPSPRQYWVG